MLAVLDIETDREFAVDDETDELRRILIRTTRGLRRVGDDVERVRVRDREEAGDGGSGLVGWGLRWETEIERSRPGALAVAGFEGAVKATEDLLKRRCLVLAVVRLRSFGGTNSNDKPTRPRPNLNPIHCTFTRLNSIQFHEFNWAEKERERDQRELTKRRS